MNNLTIVELLCIIRKKIFEPRQKISKNSNGEQYLEIKNLLDDQQSILEKYEGWNIADKDYVDYRISELLHKLNSQPSKNPLLPPLPSISNSKSILISKSTINENILEFFNTGIIMKPNWVISEFTIFTDNVLDGEFSLYIKNLIDNKESQLSKFRLNKQILTADSNFKCHNSNPVMILLKYSKPLPIKPFSCILQIIIES